MKPEREFLRNKKKSWTTFHPRKKVFAPLLSLEKKVLPPSSGMSKNLLAPLFFLKKVIATFFVAKENPVPPFFR